MAKATVAKVLEEIKTLTPVEQDQVRKLLDEIKSEQATPPASEAEADAEANWLRKMEEEGLLIPRAKTDNEPPRFLLHEPIEVKGRPVSETLIEERR